MEIKKIGEKYFKLFPASEKEATVIKNLSFRYTIVADEEVYRFISLDGVFRHALLSRIQKHLKLANVPFKRLETQNFTIVNSDIQQEISFIKFREYQAETIRKCLEQKQGIIKIPCGGGKTEIQIGICYYLAKHGLTSLLLVPSQDLLIQTKSRFNRYGIQVDCWGAGLTPNQGCNIVIAIPDSVFNRIEFLSKFSCLVFDEVHHFGMSKTWHKLVDNSASFHFLLGFSATPFLGNKEPEYRIKDLNIISYFGEIIIDIPRNFLEECGYLSRVSVLMLNIQVDIRYQGRNFQVIEKMLASNTQVNNQFVRIARLAKSKNRKILIIVRRIDHGIALLKAIGQDCLGFASGGGKLHKINHLGNIQIFSSKNFTDEFEKSKACIAIGSVIFAEAKDLPSCDTLIYCLGLKSPIKVLQGIGRLNRVGEKKTALMIDFNFVGNNILGGHSKRRKREYVENSYEIRENVGISDLDLHLS